MVEMILRVETALLLFFLVECATSAAVVSNLCYSFGDRYDMFSMRSKYELLFIATNYICEIKISADESRSALFK
jgi:hypothetical protein